MEEAVHVNRLLTRKLAEARENVSEGLQDFTCLHTGNGPNRATRIPAKLKPSCDVRLSAEPRLAVCHARCQAGSKAAGEANTQAHSLHVSADVLLCSWGGRNFCTPTGGLFAMCLVPLLLGSP